MIYAKIGEIVRSGKLGRERRIKPASLRIESIAAFAAAAIMFSVLIIRPITGVANNGDFERVMQSTGLEYISADQETMYFGYINREYRMTRIVLLGGGYFTTEIFMVIAAKLVNYIASFGTDIFDIRYLAFLYMIVASAAIYLAVKYNKTGSALTNWAMAILLVVAFTDVGYISYFNSLYGEALSFSFLLLTVSSAVMLVSGKVPKISTLSIFYVAAAFLAGAKLQNMPIGVVLAAFGLRLAQLRKDPAWKKAVAMLSLLVLLVSFASYLIIPEEIRVCNKYQTVFYGVLKDSPTPESDLAELGIRQELSVLAGTNYFMEKYPINIKSPEFIEEINRNINPAKIALFYIKHPARFVDKLRISAQNGFRLLQGFGSYEKSEGLGYGKTARFPGLWSYVKEKIMPHSIGFVAAIFILYFLGLIMQYIKSSSMREQVRIEIFMLVGIFGIMQFVIPIIGDGEADLSKHLFLFSACFDIMFITCAMWLVNKLGRVLSSK